MDAIFARMPLKPRRFNSKAREVFSRFPAFTPREWAWVAITITLIAGAFLYAFTH